MTMPREYWWDSAPELIETAWQPVTPPFGPFRGVTTNPMLMLEACKQDPPAQPAGSGWELYLTCCARSARYLLSRGLAIPFCVQLDPRSAFDAAAMLRQAAQIRARIPSATIKVPLTAAGIDIIRPLVSAGAAINGTWGFSVAQLAAAAAALHDARDAAEPAAWPRHVLTLMEGRIGDLGLKAHVGDDPRRLRAAECVVFEAAYRSLRRYRDVVTLLASSLRKGPGDECWHYGSKAGREVILTLPPSFLHQQGLPSDGAGYGCADEHSRAAALGNEMVRRYAAPDGFEPQEFDWLPPLISTRGEAVRAMESFEDLAGHG
jgi:transaldolase